MIIRVNNDVILGLTTGHWSRQAWPQCDITIDPTYHRFPYFRTGQIHNNREKVPTFVYIIVNIPAPRPLNNNACVHTSVCRKCIGKAQRCAHKSSKFDLQREIGSS